MKFFIKRLRAADNARRYHLYDATNTLLLVADYSSPCLSGDEEQEVRIARPDGFPLATLELPQPRSGKPERQRRTRYAVIHDHAVYALINAEVDPTAAIALPYYVVEVEGLRWLALAQPAVVPGGGCALGLALYAETAAHLAIYAGCLADDLPQPMGALEPQSDGYILSWTLPPDCELAQPDLLALALAFLLELRGK